MRGGRVVWELMLAGLLWLSLGSESVLGCATCFGASDSELAKGMNAGIMSLLVVIVCVLGGVASFFVFLARRSASMNAASGRGESTAAASVEESLTVK